MYIHAYRIVVLDIFKGRKKIIWELGGTGSIWILIWLTPGLGIFRAAA